MIRSRRLVWLMVSAAALCLLATSPASAARPHHKPPASRAIVSTTLPATPALQFKGDAMGPEPFYTPDSAEDMMRKVQGAGLNSVRIEIVWNEEKDPATGQPTIPSQNSDAVCNAAHSAEQFGLTALMLGLQPSAGLWPATDAQRSDYTASIGAYDKRLFGGGCLSPMSRLTIMWMIGNEPNLKSYCDVNKPDDTARQLDCAQRDAMLLHVSYAFIQSEKSTYGVQMPVVSAGISSHGTPVAFLDMFCNVRKALGYTSPDTNYFAYHPYALPGPYNPVSGMNLEPKMVQHAKACGISVPVIYAEMGVETIPPAGMDYGDSPASVSQVSESDWMKITTTLWQTALGQGVAGCFNFLMLDEQRAGGWQSGLYYWNGTPKTFLLAFQTLMQSLTAPVRGPKDPPTP